MFGSSYTERLADWEEGNRQWSAGMQSDFAGGWQPKAADETMSYEEWDGPRPDPRDYMPEWPVLERTHWCMYETTSEGTPISPVFATPEELARWLTDNRASAFAGLTATYEQWLATCRKGYSIGAVRTTDHRFLSGVELNGEKATSEMS